MLFLYDSSTAARREKKLAARSADDAGKGARLLCARCGHPVTRHRERIARLRDAGRSEPRAPVVRGLRVAHCELRGLSRDLGWRYERGADGFFGLILERLAEEN